MSTGQKLRRLRLRGCGDVALVHEYAGGGWLVTFSASGWRWSGKLEAQGETPEEALDVALKLSKALRRDPVDPKEQP